MLQLLRTRRARKAAVAAILPRVDASRRRLDGIPDHIWLEPYMIGFVCMLITLIARRAVGPLTSHSMGLVQMDAWSDITGLKPDLVGVELCLLSSAQDEDFTQGCRDASTFASAPAVGDDLEMSDERQSLWEVFVDVRIAAGRDDNGRLRTNTYA